MGLFKRKPGGTLFGNLLRKAASSVSGGALGGGAMMITQEDADKRDMSDQEYQAKYGKTKLGVTLNIDPRLVAMNGGANVSTPQTFDTLKAQGIAGVLKKYWWAFAIPVVLIIGLAYKAFSKRR